MIFGFNSTGALGDYTYITAALNVLDNCIVQLHDTEQCRDVSVIFNNLAKVEFVNDPPHPIYKDGNKSIHAAQKVLDKLGITEVNCIPKIRLTQEEIEWAKKFLENYKNPVVVVNDNGGSGDKNNFCAQYKRPPVFLIQNIVNRLKELNYTVLQFGRNDHKDFPNCYTPLNNAIHIRGLSLRQLAACYHVIGKFIGGDTGDYHLMLSVGGKSIDLIPPENPRLGFIYDELLYYDFLWKNEKPRVKYICFNNIENINDDLLIFNW